MGTWTAVALSVGPAAARDDKAPAAPVRLAGEWYVLVHYGERPRPTSREDAPEAPRQETGRPDPGPGPSDTRAGEDPGPVDWDDEIWRLDVRSDRLVWTLYPHVVFRDPSGRYVRLPSGGEARTEGAWTPSAAQRAEIERGLEPDPHESRRKTLRATPSGGYRSAGMLRPASASAIAYGETWAIEGPPARPVFVRHARLASGRTDPAEGRTTFTTRRVLAGGDELRGDYERDGRLVGGFRMIRMGVGEDAGR